MSYYYDNEHLDEPDDFDLTQAEDQIQREEDFDKYCDDIKDIHEEMMEYVKYSKNPSLMENSDYLDLMELIRKGEYKFTFQEEQKFLRSKSSKYGFANRSKNDNIDLSYLFHTFELDSEIENSEFVNIDEK